MSNDERGQVAPLLALLAVVLGLATLGLGRFGSGAVAAARAQTAADGAALAAATAPPADGEAAARRLATANGGAVLTYERAGPDVRVRVRVGAETASARARAAPASPAVPTGPAPGLAPALQAALARAGQLLGGPIPVTSGVRSPVEQHRLWAHRSTNPYPVAPPGTSMHERGLAVDVPPAVADRLAATGRSTGLCRPYPTSDPVHFELCERRFPPTPLGRLRGPWLKVVASVAWSERSTPGRSSRSPPSSP